MTKPEKYKIEYRLLNSEGFIYKEGTARIKNAYGEFDAKMKFFKAVEKKYGKTYKVEILKCSLDFMDFLNRIIGK